jgi:hypothetical protein
VVRGAENSRLATRDRQLKEIVMTPKSIFADMSAEHLG